MKKIICFILVSWTSLSVKSQQLDFLLFDTINQSKFHVSSIFDYGSNVANNHFLNQFIFGNYIDRKEKDELYSKLGSNNNVGGDFQIKIQAEIPIDTFLGKKNFTLIIGAEHNEHFDGSFSKDLAHLIFDGNKQFAGKYANIGSTNFNYMSYQQLNVGFVNFKKNRVEKLREGAIFSIIKAQDYQALVVPEGSLFTHQFGKELQLDLNYNYNSSDSTKKELSAFNGFGLATDLFTQFQLKNGAKINVQINDLGFIQWNSKSIQIEADTVITYDGIEIDNIFDLNDSLISSFSQDSLLDYISTKKSNTGFTIALPTTFDINFEKQINSKMNVIAGFRYKILSNYFPMVYTSLQYFVHPSFMIQGNILYGGYGKFNAGLTVVKQIRKKVEFLVGTNHLGAYILPSSTYSNNGFIGLKVYF